MDHAANRCVIQPTTMHLPAISTDIRACAVRVGARVWRASGQPAMRAVTVVLALKIDELPLQIDGRPEQVRSRHSRRMVPMSSRVGRTEKRTHASDTPNTNFET